MGPEIAQPEFLQWLATLGVGGAIAAFMFLFYRRDNEAMKATLKGITDAYTEKMEDLHELEKGRADMLLSVVRGNTEAVTANTEVVRSMHRRLDSMDGGRTHSETVDIDRRRRG